MNENFIDPKPTGKKPEKGCILVSDPFSQDTYFKRSVVLISEYNEKGTIGFILNKPMNASLNDAMKIKTSKDFKLFMGGPVKTDTLYYLHTLGNVLENSVEIVDGVYWGGEFDTLVELINTNQVTKDQVRFYVGYSGWDKKQLDEELDSNSWLIVEGKNEFILYDDSVDLWKDTLYSIDSNYKKIKEFPEDPQHN